MMLLGSVGGGAIVIIVSGAGTVAVRATYIVGFARGRLRIGGVSGLRGAARVVWFTRGRSVGV
jgi:hypothetical protein